MEITATLYSYRGLGLRGISCWTNAGKLKLLLKIILFELSELTSRSDKGYINDLLLNQPQKLLFHACVQPWDNRKII